MQSPVIIRTNSQFRNNYHSLKRGDVVLCVLNLKPFEEYLFTDLIHRGIILFPPAISQIASRSKCFQARIFHGFMVPDTRVLADRKDLVKTMNEYAHKGVGQIITKRDRADCGLGINVWRDCEELFNHITFSNHSPWPIVVQPFIPDAIDIRIVWIGNRHMEAYWRKNTASFRNNLHFGGKSGRYELDKKEQDLCKEVMSRGEFPYAHIDLLKTPGGEVYLSEVSLFGGTKGASINSVKCSMLKKEVEEDFLDSLDLG